MAAEAARGRTSNCQCAEVSGLPRHLVRPFRGGSRHAASWPLFAEGVPSFCRECFGGVVRLAVGLWGRGRGLEGGGGFGGSAAGTESPSYRRPVRPFSRGRVGLGLSAFQRIRCRVVAPSCRFCARCGVARSSEKRRYVPFGAPTRARTLRRDKATARQMSDAAERGVDGRVGGIFQVHPRS